MKLLEFPHSHYCEKARWALDHKGVLYQRVSVMPGLHLKRIRKIAPDSSVPVLLDGERVIQGSSQIIDYLDATIPDASLTPADPDLAQRCRDLEAEFDMVFGLNIRRALYFYLLPHPGYVRHCFMSRSPWYERWLFAAAYPKLREKISDKYDIACDEVATGLVEMDAALERWDAVLRPGQFVCGGRFTRADLTLASMLYFAGLPTEFESPWPAESPDDESRKLLEKLRNSNTVKWVEDLYRTHRTSNRVDRPETLAL